MTSGSLPELRMSASTLREVPQSRVVVDRDGHDAVPAVAFAAMPPDAVLICPRSAWSPVDGAFAGGQERFPGQALRRPRSRPSPTWRNSRWWAPSSTTGLSAVRRRA